MKFILRRVSLCLLLLSITTVFSYSQIDYNNKVVTEPDNTGSRNYKGSNIKELTIKFYDLSNESDTSGIIITRQYFDAEGNKTSSVAYENYLEVSRTIYEYDSLNKLINVVYFGKEDSIFMEKIKYDKDNNVSSFRKNHRGGNYANVQCKYDENRMLKELSYDWRINYNIRFYNSLTLETMGIVPTKDSEKHWIHYKYYSGETPEIKNSIAENISKEYCKLDQNNNIVNVKKMVGGKLTKNISIKYNKNNRIIEKMFLSELDSVKPYKYVYFYSYY